MRLLFIRSEPGWRLGPPSAATPFPRVWGILFVLKLPGKPLLFWRAWAKLLLPLLAMDPLRVDRLLTPPPPPLSKTLSASDASNGGMSPIHAVITRWDVQVVGEEPDVFRSRPGLWDSLCCFSNKLFFAIVPFLVLPHLLSSLTLGGPALCLNFGPSSELGVNEGVGSLLVSFFLGFHGIFSFAPLVGSSFFPCQGCCSCRKFVKGWYSSMWYYAGALPFRWPPPFTKYGRSLPQSSFVPPLSLSDSSRVPGVLFGLRFLILATSSVSSSYGLPMFFL